MIFDSDVVIWMLRKHPPALAFARSVDPGECNLSAISYVEILRGCRDRTEAKDFALFMGEWFSDLLPLTPEITSSAVSLADQFALSRRPDVADILIAATALSRRETLATGNVKHFQYIPGLALRHFKP